jgi:hypothetical protein
LLDGDGKLNTKLAGIFKDFFGKGFAASGPKIESPEQPTIGDHRDDRTN